MHVGLARQPVALAAVAWRAARDDVVPRRRAALGARDHVVDGEVASLASAVLAGPAVAGEDRAAGDLATVRVTRNAHVGDEPDDHGSGHREALGVERPLGVLDDLGALLQYEHGGPANRAHVDRLVRGVEHQHPAQCSPTLLWPDARQRGHGSWLFASLLYDGRYGAAHPRHSAASLAAAPGATGQWAVNERCPRPLQKPRRSPRAPRARAPARTH